MENREEMLEFYSSAVESFEIEAGNLDSLKIDTAEVANALLNMGSRGISTRFMIDLAVKLLDMSENFEACEARLREECKIWSDRKAKLQKTRKKATE